MMSLVNCQKSIQADIAPGKWFFPARACHEEREKWTVSASKPEFFAAVKAAIKDDKFYEVYKEDEKAGTMKCTVLTPGAKWLDIVELEYKSVEEGKGVVVARSYSSGILPLIIPFAPIINVALFLIPFGDGGKCQLWLKRIRDSEGFKSKVDAVERVQISIGNPDKKR